MDFNNKKPDISWTESAVASSLNDDSAFVFPFNPSDFLIPGWKGEGLISASAITIKNSLSNLSIDAQALFKKSWSTTKSMKLQTYNEFLQFADYAQIDKSLLTQPQDFWFHVQDDTSPLRKSIDDFFKVHCFRAVATYLFKIKFILDLAKEQSININEDVLMNPHSFLGRIFVKNSSTELHCDSLRINQYSWYRPSAEYKESLIKLKFAFENITITELAKLISTPKDDKIYSIRNYSHSLSHLSFGLFLNDLLVKFPSWLNQEPNTQVNAHSYNKLCILPKTINTRFAGNHVSSLALSHWLAQEENVKGAQWNHLICPEFEGQEFIDGQFLKICQELQFLSFLTRLATIRKFEIIPFICKIMREKYKSTLEDSLDQVSFFNLGALATSEALYGRIVLNVTELPKSNPHHYLIQQIQAQKPFMKKDAVIYLFTNQKLFVPSHKDRLEQLLADFKVEASFNLEELKGKGEIANYAYVLTRRTLESTAINKHLFQVKRKLKESCLSFEFKGNLSRFNKFQKMIEEFSFFLKNKNPISTPIYTNEIEKDLSFEFHQDAIVDGNLVSSVSGKDSAQQTHPSFFKNLTKSSISLGSFFNIDQISHDESSYEKRSLSSELLGIKMGPEKQYPLLLIVNQNDPLDIKIELTPIDAYKGKLEQYGTAFYSYFGITPKHPAINLNVFREYFSSVLGHQIIQLQLSDGPTKLRAKLRSLLVPSFFASTQFMPNSIKSKFNLLELEAREIKGHHPELLKDRFAHVKSEVMNQSKEFPWHILGLLSHFKTELSSLVDELEDSKIQTYNFGNSLIANELVKLKSQAIYTKNPDVFVKITVQKPQELQLPLTSLVIKNEEDFSYLEFKNNDKEVVQVHASTLMLHFIKFLLQGANGMRIDEIVANLRVPSDKDLTEVTKKFEDVKLTKIQLFNETKDLISFILRTEVSR